jgi:hypothetical protein
MLRFPMPEPGTRRLEKLLVNQPDAPKLKVYTQAARPKD